ncbi:MAG: hypothetical protein EOP91_00285 [Lysobacteraceae bacterium]|nr:MAG: hypothetical protein EOP91_00285 [Xanthomonadaceae bacterium]
MKAEFFVIMPSLSGWELYHGMQGQGWFARWDDALEAADVMAEARHHLAGVATTVIVEMGGREAAIVSVYA